MVPTTVALYTIQIHIHFSIHGTSQTPFQYFSFKTNSVLYSCTLGSVLKAIFLTVQFVICTYMYSSDTNSWLCNVSLVHQVPDLFPNHSRPIPEEFSFYSRPIPEYVPTFPSHQSQTNYYYLYENCANV